MSPISPSSTDISTGLSKLSIDPPDAKNTTKAKPKKKKVVDSWEDEDLSGDDDGPQQPDSQPDSAGTFAPPPTPISPTYGALSRPLSPRSSGPSTPSSYHIMTDSPESSSPRPEKTDAVARRMIASALGMRVPKQTEEQRAYDKAIREKERKRREEEKAAEKEKQEEAAKARAAMWKD